MHNPLQHTPSTTKPLPLELDRDFDGPVYEWIHKEMQRHRDMEELDRLGY